MKLSDFDHLLDDPTVQFKDETVDGVELVTICYMISNPELWDKPLGDETRGHVFRRDAGECVSMAFHKFFNLNENKFTQEHELDFEGMTVLEKRDGSMITAALINDKVYFKTKKSFYSDVAKLANKLAPVDVVNFTKTCLMLGFFTNIRIHTSRLESSYQLRRATNLDSVSN